MTMRNFFLIVFALFSLNVLQADLLDDIASGNFKTKKPDIPFSMKDGEHYIQMTDSQTIVKVNYKTGIITDTLLSISKIKNKVINSFDGYILSPKETRILVYKNLKYRYRRSYTAEYYIYDIKYKEFDPLSARVPQESPVFSADDRYIAFAHQNNLFMKKVDFKTDIQITKDGSKGKIINGIADWVYEEEFEHTCHYAWSPDSKLLAYIKFNESEVKEFGYQKFLRKVNQNETLSFYPETVSYKYPRPGEKNAVVSVCIYDDFNKTTRTVQLNTKETDIYIPRIRWTNQADQLAVFVLNRNQNRLDMLLANAKTALSKLILRQEDKRYIDYQHIDNLKFSSDNQSFYLTSDRDGYTHLYQYSINGTQQKKITSGKWDLTAFYGINESNKTIYYQSAEVSPLSRSIYAIDNKGKKINLSSLQGTSNAWFSNTFKYFVLQESNTTTPDSYSIRNSSGGFIRNIEKNDDLLKKAAAFTTSRKAFIKINTASGNELNAWILKPADFNASKKYPLIMVQYSGPGSQQVLDKWEIGWEYYLISKGFVVACVDGRGTGARGSEFLKSTYKQMGILEAQDQVEAAQYFGNTGYIDASRIGIWGWSYGGSNTIWSMSTGQPVFKAGIAVAPVTDWRYYNTAYTERFMSTPEENFEGYEKTSAFNQVEKLNGRLLLIHGTADDNVHYQNTLILADKLVEAGKQFEMQIYTDKNHSITGKTARKHIYRRMAEFFETYL